MSLISLQLFDTLLHKDDEHIVHNLVLRNLETRDYFNPINTKQATDTVTEKDRENLGDSSEECSGNSGKKEESLKSRCDGESGNVQNGSKDKQEGQSKEASESDINDTENKNNTEESDSVTKNEEAAITDQQHGMKRCEGVKTDKEKKQGSEGMQ